MKKQGGGGRFWNSPPIGQHWRYAQVLCFHILAHSVAGSKLNSFLFNRFHTLCRKTPGVGDVLLTDRLLRPGGGSSHGVSHIAAGLFAKIALALVAAFKV